MAKMIVPMGTDMHLDDEERRYLTGKGMIVWDCSAKAYVLANGKSMADFRKKLDDFYIDDDPLDEHVYGDLDDGA